MRPRLLRPLIAALITLSTACRSAAPSPPVEVPVVQVPVAQLPAAPEAAREPERSGPPLRIVIGDDPRIEAWGRPLGLGISMTTLRAVLGEPAFDKAYPDDGSAMANTLYLSYAQGIAVRTKDGIVEGYFVYLRKAETDTGRFIGPADPELPGGLTRDSSIAQVIAALGAPTSRAPFELMHWDDLLYVRGGTLVKVHFNRDELTTVSVEYADDKAPRR